MHKEEKRSYVIVEKRSETANVTTLKLMPVEAPRDEFLSGQFITVYFPELGVAEGKAYSISSAPHEEGFTITVKDIGTFSHRLSTMSVGETLSASGPYGYFYSEEADSPLVLLAGGIGIAPFKSIASDLLEKNPTRKISLYYSVSHYPDAVFLETFSTLARKHPSFTYTIHVTKERGSEPESRSGRISVDRIAHLHKSDANAEYFMCGSIPFVRDMWRNLRSYNIPEERLYTEAFFG